LEKFKSKELYLFSIWDCGLHISDTAISRMAHTEPLKRNYLLYLLRTHGVSAKPCFLSHTTWIRKHAFPRKASPDWLKI